MFARLIRNTSCALALASGMLAAHESGPHPTGLPRCEDAPLGITWFYLFGAGVRQGPDQDFLDPQEFELVNSSDPGRLPRAAVRIGWAMWGSHQSSYGDFNVHIVRPSRTLTYQGGLHPSGFEINPLLDGWSGSCSVILEHRECGFTMTARASWSFPRPESPACADCENLTCPLEAEIGSVKLSMPVGPLRFGSVGGRIAYKSDEIANGGMAALTYEGAPGAQLTYGPSPDRFLSTATCGNHFARVSADPVAGDPKRFRVEVSSDAANPEETVFRTSTVENVALDGGGQALLVTETVAGATTTRQFGNPDPNVWVLEENGLRRTTETLLSETGTTRIKRIEIEERNPSGTWVTVDVREEHETSHDWGWELTRRIIDPDGTALTTGWDYYDRTEFSGPNGDTSGRGLLQSVTFPDGSTRHHEYHDTNLVDPSFDRLEVTREPFAGTPDAREVLRHFSATDSTLTERRDTYVHGTLVDQRDVSVQSGGSTPWREETRYASPGGPPHVTRTDYDTNPNTPLFRRTTYPDGTVEVVEERFAGDLKTTTIFRGVPNPGAGPPILAGTETESTVDGAGQILRTADYEIRGGVTFRMEERIATQWDDLRRPVAYDVFHGNRTGASHIETVEYGCCGVSREEGADRTPTFYFHDGLGRLTKTHRSGISTETVRDGLVVRTHRYPEETPSGLSLATPGNLASSVTRNLTGDIVSEQSRSPRDNSLVATTTSVTYNPGGGIGRRVVRTLPAVDGDQGVPATITEETFLDGRLASRTGSPVVDRDYAYGADGSGLSTTVTLRDDAGSPVEPVTTRFDWLERPVSVVFAGDADGNGEPDRETSSYDFGGRPLSRADADGVATLFDHDLLNDRTTTAIDRNGNGLIDLDADEIRTTQGGITTNAAGRVVLLEENLVRDVDDAGAGIERLVTRRESTADALQSWKHSYEDGIAVTTRSETTRLPAPAGSWDTVITSPDGTALLQRFRNGLLVSEEFRSGDGSVLFSRSYSHDAHRRVVRIDDSRGPSIATGYVAPLVDLPATRSVGTRLTAYGYDHRGRRTLTDEPDTTEPDGALVNNRRVTDYFPNGKLRAATGAPGHDISYTYDHAHRIRTLTTNGSTPAVTRWEYDPDRGWLVAKRFNSPAPGAGTGPVYAYTAAGRIRQRTSPREIATDYSYDASGRLLRTDYSDGTPSVVVLERDRLGRTVRLGDAGGERRFSHNDHDVLVSEHHETGHLMDGWEVVREHDTLQRLTGLALAESDLEQHRIGYRHDSAGRLEMVESGDLAAFLHYDPAHQRSAQLSVVDTTGPLLFATRTYDPLRRLARVSYHNGKVHQQFALYSDHQYQRDGFGRIVAATPTDRTQWRYAFHPSGELATAHRHLDQAGATRLAGGSLGFSYDGIGNRLVTRRGGDPSGNGLSSTVYNPNALNQYDAIQHPAIAPVAGEAPSGTTVLVNGVPAARQGPFFHREIPAPNAGGPAWTPVTVSNGSDAESGHLLVPPATANRQYDLEGNLISDGIHTFTWDAENRLTEVETTTASVAAGVPYLRVAYTYDSDSRLIRRLVFDGPSAVAPGESTRFLHAGWRRLGELDASGQLVRTFTWGTDRNDALHLGDPNAALLWIHDARTGESHLATFDGNGNLTGLLSARSRQPTARYLYSPFGRLLTATGPYAEANPYRFSTQFHDPATGFVHFGHRWLHPATGRWLSRDPLAENAGAHLYAFLGNDPLNDHDLLGREGAGRFAAAARDAAVGFLRAFPSTAAEYYRDAGTTAANFYGQVGRRLIQTREGLGSLLGAELSHLTNSLRDPLLAAEYGQLLSNRADRFLGGVNGIDRFLQNLQTDPAYRQLAWCALKDSLKDQFTTFEGWENFLVNANTATLEALLATRAAGVAGKGSIQHKWTTSTPSATLTTPYSPVRALPFDGQTVSHQAGTIRSFSTTYTETYFRVYSGTNSSGAFLSKQRPLSADWAIEAFALPPGNRANFLQEVVVPAGTRLQRSRAAPNIWGRGGGEQFEILKLQPDAFQPVDFGPGVPFR